MQFERNRNLTVNARMLRKNSTKEERKLWYAALSESPVRFRRQQIIGNYIVDFYCDAAKLAIELDGSQHFEQEALEKDKQRTEYIHSQGIEVLRFTNADIHDRFDAVKTAIYRTVCERLPPSASLRSAAPPQGAPRG